MGLYERIAGTEQPKIPVHQFMAALGEWELGKMTRANIISLFGIQASEEADMDAMVAKVGTIHEGHALSGRVTLTNVGAAYDANLDSQSLPFVYVQQAGVKRLDIELRVNKIGTGTQDWQLWNETDATAAIGPGALTTGSLSDANGAGHRTLNASRTFASPLAPGVKKLRLRCQSSVAADDPVFLNGAILLFRTDTVTAEVLHRILLLGEVGIYTVAQMKARLGVV